MGRSRNPTKRMLFGPYFALCINMPTTILPLTPFYLSTSCQQPLVATSVIHLCSILVSPCQEPGSVPGGGDEKNIRHRCCPLGACTLVNNLDR